MNPDNKKAAGQDMVFDKYVAIALVVGIIAGFIIGNSVGASKSKVDDEEMNATTTSESALFNNKEEENQAESLQGGEWLKVENQKPGHYVSVSKLTIDKPYWVAIQDSRTTNARIYILGAQKIQPGMYAETSIYVPRATEAGKTYDLVFYEDRGDFSFDPTLLVRSGTEPVGATFTAN